MKGTRFNFCSYRRLCTFVGRSYLLSEAVKIQIQLQILTTHNPKVLLLLFFLLKYTLLRQPLQKNRHLRFEHNVNFFETFKFAAIWTSHSSQRQYYPDTTLAFCSRWRPCLLRVRTKFWKGPTEPCKFWSVKCARSEVMPISFTGSVPLSRVLT